MEDSAIEAFDEDRLLDVLTSKALLELRDHELTLWTRTEEPRHVATPRDYV